MSRKSQIADDLQKYAGGGMISRVQVAQWLGYKDAHSADPVLHDLPKMGRRYYIVDVAERIADSLV